MNYAKVAIIGGVVLAALGFGHYSRGEGGAPLPDAYLRTVCTGAEAAAGVLAVWDRYDDGPLAQALAQAMDRGDCFQVEPAIPAWCDATPVEMELYGGIVVRFRLWWPTPDAALVWSFNTGPTANAAYHIAACESLQGNPA